LADLDLRYIPTVSNVSNWKLFREVTRLIWNEDFDLVHSHGFTAGVCSILGSQLRRVPHIITLHETLGEERFIGIGGWLRRIGLGVLLSFSDAIQCVSHDARENLLCYMSILRLFEQKVSVIENGIEVERFLTSGTRDLRQELGLPENSFLIGFLGRHMPEKGFTYLLGALDNLKKEEGLPRQPLLLSFGQEDGYIREEKINVKERGLSEWVHFLSFAPDVGSTLKGLDVIAMPSLREACGLLAMEAMVAGVPLIGTNCIGLREVLRGTVAGVVPPGDSHALSEALVREMRNPTKAKAREFAKEAAARFQVRERAAEIEKLMLKFLER
jgi:glycosyltransferase involved in cell wall biosynthesis